MNHVYRIVFNRALGLCQVVSELASAHGGGAKAVRLVLRPSLLANACLLALGMTVVATAGAQTVIENRVMEVDSPADLSGDVTLGSNGELRGTADVTLGNRLRIEAATTPTISATAGTTLTLSGGYDLGHEAGLAFGSAGHTGTVVYSAFGYQYQGTPGALNVNYGTLRAGTAYLPSLLQDMLSTNIAAGATLDLNDQNRSIPTASITNLQGAGTLVTGTLADSVVAIDEGTFAGAILGAGGIEKRGSGTLTLRSVNTYSGGTTINGGTLALGAGGSLAAAGAVNLSDASAVFDISAATVDQTIGSLAGVAGSTVTLGATTLNIGSNNSSTLHAGSISGTGNLIKHGTGGLTLTGSSSYDFTSIYGGTLTIKDGGTVSNETGHIGPSLGSITAATVSGTGSTWAHSNELVVGLLGTGVLTVADGGTVSNLNGVIGYTSRGNGQVTVTGTNSTWSNNDRLSVGSEGRGTLSVADGGKVSVNQSSGPLHIAQFTGSTGTVNIGGAVGEAAVAAGTLEASELRFGAGTGSLNFNHTDAAYAFGTRITGAGTVNQVAGTTLLTGANSYTGGTVVSGGTLAINGSVMSDVQVNAAGTLGGNGHIGGNVNVLGTLSAGNSPGTLNIGGNLVLGTDSTSVFELGQADAVGGPANDLVEVGGDLTLGGTLQAQAASAGWYRLFNYGGTLSGAFSVTDVSSSRTGFTVASHAVDTASANQVNLTVLAAGQSIQFWDGSNTSPSGSVGGAGGIGNWTSADTTWTNDSATTNSNWGGSVAHFGGTTGTVSVVGTQRFDTLQFASDGYVLTGGTLALSPASGSYATINTDTGVSATIDSNLINSGLRNGLIKVGNGTLILRGANTYSGIGTQVLGGTLRVAHDSALGSHQVVVDNVAGNNATLLVDAGIKLANSVFIDNSGTLDNFGTIEQAGSDFGVGSMGGATINNAAGASIRSDGHGVLLYDGGTINNRGGEISAGNWGVHITGASGQVNNDPGGSISGKIIGVMLMEGGSVANSGAAITGTDTDSLGIQVLGGSGTITNDAGSSITGDASGILLGAGGTVINHGGAIIASSTTGTSRGISIDGGAGTVINSAGGIISGQRQGVILAQGGSLSNELGATIHAGETAVYGYEATTLRNAGMIQGDVSLSDKVNQVSLFTGSRIDGNLEIGKHKASMLTLDGSGSQLFSAAVTGITHLEGILFKQGAGGWIIDSELTQGSTTIAAGVLQIGDGGTSGSITGDVINNATLAFNRSDDVIFSGDISGSGVLQQLGSGTLSIGAATHTGGTLITNGTLQIGNGGSTGALGGDVVNNATLAFNRNTLLTVAGDISGSGAVQQRGSGTTLLTGNNIYTGTTSVDAGTLEVNGSLLGMGAVSVGDGGTLAGSGTIAGAVTIHDGGTLQLLRGGTLHTGALSLGADAQVTAILGLPSSTALVAVNGDLALNGSLNVLDGGGLSAGVYRLADYTGALSGVGLAVGSSDFSVQTSVARQVNLINKAGQTLQFWDGGSAGNFNNSVIDGGSGIWTTSGPNWTDQDGTLNGPATPQPVFAIFQGNAGTVIVDNGRGAPVAVTGLQFTTDGYALTGDVLELMGTNAIIRVGDGALSSVSAHIAAELTGSAHLMKMDGGTLILSADNHYSGGTTISAGTLQIGKGGVSGSITGDVINNAALAFNRRDDVVFAGDISGSGILRQLGNGTTTLSGNNSYSGGTEIIAGTLEVGDGGTSGAIAGDVLNNAALAFNRSDDVAFAGNITGSGVLQQIGSGTTTLSGSNNYSGGTTVTAGILQIGNGGTSGSITGDVINNATLAFNHSDDVAFAGNITGSGALQQFGNGTTTLSGINSYSGGTIITTGTLAGNAGNLGSGAIDIAAAATLAVQQSSDASFANLFSGSGRINKNGGGTLTVTGDSAAFTGTTHINAGTLAVNGALGGALNVHDGTTLKGTGSVGSTVVMAGGTIAPGNSIGRLNVAGDLTFAAGSTYQIEATPDGNADHIHASGAIALQGGSAMVLAADGSWSPSTTYQVLSAGAGISGAFDEVSSNFAFLAPTLTNDGHVLSLTLARNQVLFPAVATTPNQIATSTAIENLGTGNDLYDVVVQLDEANAVSAFDQLSGEIHASVRAGVIQDGRFVREAAIDRLRQSEGAQDAANDVSSHGNAWGRMYGSWGRQDGDGNAARSKRSTGGIVVGGDRHFDNWNVGLMAASSHSKLDVDARRSHAKVDSYQLGLYAGTTLGDAAELRSGVQFGRHSIETDRTITFTGVNERNRADYAASSVQAFSELGWKLPTRVIELEPFANLAYVGMTSESFREHAGISALSARKESTDTLFSTLGLRAGSTFSAGTVQANWRVMAGWRHAFNDVTGNARLAFANDDSSFAINGLPVADDTLAIEAGAELRLRSNLTVGAAYSGQHGDGARDHGLKANVTWVF
ncbi:MAG: autotransporter domain-containing protein [Stenotrophomonas sp.]|uniref:autotransporter domain-containing protein n=1 Tax=Stenotrophomonas sp. TaxID=69392 RepID=UPI003D6C96CB